jgi:hypothetical protein
LIWRHSHTDFGFREFLFFKTIETEEDGHSYTVRLLEEVMLIGQFQSKNAESAVGTIIILQSPLRISS